MKEYINRPWSDEEVKYLIENYPNVDTKILAVEMNRGFHAITKKASKLGVQKTKEARSAKVRNSVNDRYSKINEIPLEEVTPEIAYKHKRWLEHHYYEKEMSLNDMAKLTPVSRKNLEYWMDRYSLRRRDNNESKGTALFKEKISNTSMGRIPFSKGLTKYDHPSIMKISESVKGEKSGRWKGGTYVNNLGYRYVRSEDHPHRNKDSYVLEHRIVMESIVGRYLTKNEVVHHRDRNRLNNSPDNLFLFPNNKAHTSFHNYQIYVDPDITEEKFMEEIYYEKYAM